MVKEKQAGSSLRSQSIYATNSSGEILRVLKLTAFPQACLDAKCTTGAMSKGCPLENVALEYSLLCVPQTIHQLLLDTSKSK